MNNYESLCLNTEVPYQAMEIDQAFALELKNAEIKNADFLLNYIEQYWGTLDNFLRTGQRQGLSSSLVRLLLNKFNENKIIAWWAAWRAISLLKKQPRSQAYAKRIGTK
ncbi:hypothetical protein L3476_27470 [Paenibacillus thiaminolyticus]|uniref:hypothetical protein n=1 Tax=Paenibacillus thiaminolyticus TaxID=49283 RepID=UPI0023500AB2|nr:hypothetical protein [Paenibacillus thiaminolyticus]WCR26884.1 hypothetical protein L3476_27470 [Paenibacillus thiaminolyticus]